MRSFTFHPGPRLIAGAGRSADDRRTACRTGPCLFVTDEQTVLGSASPMLSAMRSRRPEGASSSVRRGRGRSVPKTLEAAVERAESAGVTSVVGFGGGSPMDVAKLAAYLLGSGDDLDEIWGVDIAKGQRLPLALVPTTAGTGSEATPISVITCEGGVKLAVNSRPLTADWAVLDPQPDARPAARM